MLGRLGWQSSLTYYLRDLFGEALVTEHRFAKPRRWRFDFAVVELNLAIEMEGGIHTGGRHVRGKGYQGDCEKYNQAAIDGWSVLRFTAGMVDSGIAYEQIDAFLKKAHKK